MDSQINEHDPSNQVNSTESSTTNGNKPRARVMIEPQDGLASEMPEIPSNIWVMEGCPQTVPGEDKPNERNNSSGKSSSAIPTSVLVRVDSEEFHDARDDIDEVKVSLPVPAPRIQSQTEFRIETLKHYLVSCVRNAGGEIDLNSYLDAYQEICKLLENLGTVIRNIVGNDIRSKIAVMKKHQAGANGAFYKTIDSMVTFEKVTKLYLRNPDHNGSKTILNLHRSLGFVAAFLSNLNSASLHQTLGGVARDAYNETLAHFHPGTYKVVARAAFMTLGSKRQFVANFHDGSMKDAQLKAVIGEVVTAATLVHTQCDAVFRRHNFLELA